jgi:hypothetical protein
MTRSRNQAAAIADAGGRSLNRPLPADRVPDATGRYTAVMGALDREHPRWAHVYHAFIRSREEPRAYGEGRKVQRAIAERLSAQLGVSVRTIWNYHAAARKFVFDRVAPDYARDLASAYGCDVAALLAALTEHRGGLHEMIEEAVYREYTSRQRQIAARDRPTLGGTPHSDEVLALETRDDWAQLLVNLARRLATPMGQSGQDPPAIVFATR